MSASSERNPVDAVVDLLEATDDTDYQEDKPPVIERIDDSKPQTKVNRTQDAFYVWSPTDASVDRISADGVAANSNEDVQVLIWCLEAPGRAKRYRQDVLDYLATFMDDNKQTTGLNNIEPIAQSDLRNEAIPTSSSHSVTGVTVTTDNYLRFD